MLLGEDAPVLSLSACVTTLYRYYIVGIYRFLYLADQDALARGDGRQLDAHAHWIGACDAATVL